MVNDLLSRSGVEFEDREISNKIISLAMQSRLGEKLIDADKKIRLSGHTGKNKVLKMEDIAGIF